VAHVLLVSALQFRDPVSEIVLMKAGNASVHVSAPTSGAFVGDITDSVEVKAIGVAQVVVLTGAGEPALSGIFRLRPWCVFLPPTEFRSPAELRPPS
jgi:hypothetical protein